MTENQRLKILMREIGVVRQTDFAEILNIKPGSLSDILRSKKGVSVSTAIKDKLEFLFNVNRHWIETGTGSIFKDGALKTPEDERVLKLLGKLNEMGKSSKSILETPVLAEPETLYIRQLKVPIYDVEFSAGVMTSLIESRDSHYPVGHLSIAEVAGCDAVIRAKGDSMADKINDGDWIGVKRIDDWQDWLPMGYIYAIITDQVELIKYLKKGPNEETFTIVSHNKFYEDQPIPKRLIREVWSVKAILPFSKIETII